MKTRMINAPDVFVPSSGYAQAVELTGHQRLLFISGQVPITKDEQLPEGFTAQCELVWQSLISQLKAADMDVENLVKVTIFLPSRDHISESKDIRLKMLGDHTPALTVVFADMYTDAWLLEIEAIAAA